MLVLNVVRELEKSYEGDAGQFCNFGSGGSLDQLHVQRVIMLLREILFPQFWNGMSAGRIGEKAVEFKCLLTEGICFYERLAPAEANKIVGAVLENLLQVREMLKKDIEAVYKGDPAADSYIEIVRDYPGFAAIQAYRVSHILYRAGAASYARALSEYIHRETGIDIHPGAAIGEHFFIDHGTGVVIGETTEIGNNVRIYQGVTLGALSLPTDKVENIRHQKRHPTIQDDVIIYANATILGGKTIIGARSEIGGNVWITKSVEPDTVVTLKAPSLIHRERRAALHS